jgi:2-polyprenyl-3-methyl-5-hydroxy-6-metoxy-1,4-benzoquinol methylase
MDGPDTTDPWYTERLVTRPTALWKRLIPNPYRWNLRRLGMGRVLDVGCGVGRCLEFIDGDGVGIDHNPESVAECRRRGLEAHTPEEFAALDAGRFDTILLSHVLEHIGAEDGDALVARYLPSLRDGGRVILITPQEAGQRSDPTHVRFVDAPDSERLLAELGATRIRSRSFPLPRRAGRYFLYNETIVVGTFSGGADTAD